MCSIKIKKVVELVSLDETIHVISTIFGLAPVLDRLTADGKKFFKIGVAFSIINVFILVYLNQTQERLEEIFRLVISVVSYGMLVIKRNVDFWVPQIYILGAFYQFSASDKLFSKLDHFDAYLIKNHADMKYIGTTLKYAKIGMLLYVLIWSTISILSNCWYRSLVETIALGHVYKYTIFYVHVFLVTFKVCTTLYGISLRIDSFKWILGDIKFRQFNRMDVLPRYHLKIRM